MSTKIFKNVKGVPDINNVRHDRLELPVNSKGQPKDIYWRARFNEGAIEVQTKPRVKPKTTKNDVKETSDVNS